MRSFEMVCVSEASFWPRPWYLTGPLSPRCLCVCVRVCVQPLVLSPSLKEHQLDFGIRSVTDTSSIVFVVINSNPIEVSALSDHPPPQ